jgi:hypothetical protein
MPRIVHVFGFGGENRGTDLEIGISHHQTLLSFRCFTAAKTNQTSFTYLPEKYSRLPAHEQSGMLF